MKPVDVYLEAFLLLLGSWTLAMVIAIYMALGFADLRWLFPLLLILALLPALPGWRRVLAETEPAEWRQAVAWLSLGLILAGLVLVLNRPDYDDIGYLGRRLQDSLAPFEPLTWKSWRIPFQEGTVYVKALSIGEVYDPLAIVLADLFGGHPMNWYHNILPVFITLAWVAVYVLLLDKLGVHGWRRWLALFGVIGLLCVDGAVHKSFGNFWLLRIWQGKIMMMSVLLPMLMLYVWRLMERPRRRDWVFALLLVLSGPFINRSALFLFPAVMFTFGTAYWLSFRYLSPVAPRGAARSTGGLRGMGLMLVPLLFLSAIVALATLASLENAALSPGTANALTQLPTKTALESLSKFFWRTPWLLMRDLVLLLLVPLVALSGPARLLLPIMSVLAALILFTPPWSNTIYRMLTDPAYWRVYYVLPLPLAFALVPLLFTQRARNRRHAVTLAMTAMLVVIAWVSTFERSVLSASNRTELKWPWQQRIAERDRAPLDRFHPQLSGKTVLAPNRLLHALQTKYYRDVRVSFDRAYPGTTGSPMDAHRQLSRCKVSADGIAALRHYIVNGADALIARRCGAEQADQLRAALGGIGIEQVDQAGGYALYLIRESIFLTELRAKEEQKVRELKSSIEAIKQAWQRGELQELDIEAVSRRYFEPKASVE